MTPFADPGSGHTSNGPVPLQLKLNYQHSHGWLVDFLEGLRRGEAWAMRCSSCNTSWCPPHRQCPRDRATMEWHRLSGLGTLLQATAYEGTLPFQTEVQKITLGMVHLDGAENAMLARLGVDMNAAVAGLRVQLACAPEPITHPAQAAWFLPETETP
ncbi:MAG: putative OB-fold protein [Hyphomicrobiaceae bacterium]|jgi:uncharacterized OB-fold protein